MSQESKGFNDPRKDIQQKPELDSEQFPLFEAENNQRLNDWYTYLWCFCEISRRRATSPLLIDDQNWLDELSEEVKQLRELGSSLDKRKGTEDDDEEIRQKFAAFMIEFGLEKPATTIIPPQIIEVEMVDIDTDDETHKRFIEEENRRKEEEEKAVKELIHDLKNTNNSIYLALYVNQKHPGATNLQEQLTEGFNELNVFAGHATNEILEKESQLQEMNLFQLLEIIEKGLLSSLQAEDPSKSVELKGLEPVRTFIQSHPDLVFSGRLLDFKGLLTNIGKNCVEQYRDVRDVRDNQVRANDPRTMQLKIGLVKNQVHLTIIDWATGFTNKILQFGLSPGESEKKAGWGLGFGYYRRRMSSYIGIKLGNFDFKTGHTELAIASGSITILEIPVEVKQ